MKSIQIHFYSKLILIAILSSLNSCQKGDDFQEIDEEVIIHAATTDTIIQIVVEGKQVPVFLSIPKAEGQLPAVVVKHGSGGMWKHDNPKTKKLSRQFQEWKEILTQNGFVCAVVDGYTPAGTAERTGKWKKPPYAFKISSEFVRPRYAYGTLRMLRNLKNHAGSNIVRSKDIGIIGFSHGGNTTAATLFDTDLTPQDWNWTQSYDGKEYGISNGVREPAQRPEEGGFACGVVNYGGAIAHGYWGGDPCSDNANEKIIYGNYAPVLYQLPENDYLAESTLCMFQLLKKKGFPVEMEIYNNVGHGFDDDGLPPSEEARTKTINFLKLHLHEID
nr:hypothetical protein [Allomuricauda sp.]